MIELNRVSKIYGENQNKIYALRIKSLNIEIGEVVTIMGPSGSGKTTLLNMIGAMDKPTQGKISIDGNDISKLPENKLSKYRKETIGFVFQRYYLLPNIDVNGNVLIHLILCRSIFFV